MFELQVVDILAVSTPGIALACRVRTGAVHVGDRVAQVTDDDGKSWPIDLEVRHLTKHLGNPRPADLEEAYLGSDQTIEVEVLDATEDGLVTLFGMYESVEPGRTLSG